MNNNESKLTIGIDVGGTFTDFFFYDFATDHLSAAKILTDAGAPEKTILEGIRRVLARLSGSGENIQSIIHGTTLVVNAVIERKGAKTGLLTTKRAKPGARLSILAIPDKATSWYWRCVASGLRVFAP